MPIFQAMTTITRDISRGFDSRADVLSPALVEFVEGIIEEPSVATGEMTNQLTFFK